ncbi:class I SAM-dependent methyltransferase [Aquisalimonas asiatica]|nr:class I SAM-dependent methyltransferase [Aquisalimonas asiatica]
MHPGLARFRESLCEKGWRRTLALIPRNVLHRLTDFDRRHGTDTAVEATGRAGLPEAHEPYEATSAYLFHGIIRRLSADPRTFTFVDLGSGKGKVLLLAAHYPFRRIIGVEYDARLSATAAANARRYRHPRRRVDRVETRCADAGAFDFPDGNLLIYMFNPFKAAVMVRVLANLETALRRTPRTVLVVYRNPTQRHLLDRSPLFTCVDDRAYPTRRFGTGPAAHVLVYRNSCYGVSSRS